MPCAWLSGRVASCGARSRHRRASQLDQRREGGRVVDREVSEDLAVDLDTSSLEALHESVVGHAVGASSRVDPLDPEATEVTLLGPTVPVGIAQRVNDLLLGLAVEPRTLAPVAAGAFEDDPALLLGCLLYTSDAADE